MRKAFWYAFAILYVLWVLDMVTTYLGISMGYEEGNRFYAALFSISIFWTYLFEVVIMIGIFFMLHAVFYMISNKFFIQKNIMFLIGSITLVTLIVIRIDAVVNNSAIIWTSLMR